MELALKDKVILVTGGAAGIGQEIVKKLYALEAIRCCQTNENSHRIAGAA